MNRPSIWSYWNGLGGFLVDLYRIARFRFRNPHSHAKLGNINSVRRLTGATTLIETGTYRGITARRASKLFQRVITIELDHELATASKEYLADRPNIEVIEGDALKEVTKVLARPEIDRVVLFLDGHYSGGETALGDLAEPAVEEVKILAPFREKILGIVVDDFREFGTQPGWPRKSELIASLENEFVRFGYDLAVHLDQVLVWRTTASEGSSAQGPAKP